MKINQEEIRAILRELVKKDILEVTLIPVQEDRVEERYGATEKFAKEFAKSVSKCERTKDYKITDELIFEATVLTITKFCEKVTVEECAKYSRVIRAILPKDTLTKVIANQ